MILSKGITLIAVIFKIILLIKIIIKKYMFYILLCSPKWPQSCDLPASAFQRLVLQVLATILTHIHILMIIWY